MNPITAGPSRARSIIGLFLPVREGALPMPQLAPLSTAFAAEGELVRSPLSGQPVVPGSSLFWKYVGYATPAQFAICSGVWNGCRSGRAVGFPSGARRAGFHTAPAATGEAASRPPPGP